MQLKYDKKEGEAKYKKALTELARTKNQMEKLSQTKVPVKTFHLQAKTSEKHEAVAVVLISDTHIEENVTAESVDGTNEYTLAIARKRFENLFCNTLKLVQKEQQDAHIDTLVLAILGDLISGNIHEELLETCEVPPVEAAVIAQEYLASGIEYLLNNSELNLTIPCCSGNHSRITSQVHMATEQGNSLEWMIYNNLANHFKGEKRVKFIISKSYFTWLKVFDFDIRFHHGHGMKYGSGVGGITIPVLKAIARYDLAKTANLDCFGHFHTPMSTEKFVSNGCLIGNTPYGKRLGFTGRPQQQFFLIDKHYGKTGSFPVFVE